MPRCIVICRIINLLNCWNNTLIMSMTLMSIELQHKDEICLNVICGEIRKNQLNDLWLNPKG